MRLLGLALLGTLVAPSTILAGKTRPTAADRLRAVVLKRLNRDQKFTGHVQVFRGNKAYPASISISQGEYGCTPEDLAKQWAALQPYGRMKVKPKTFRARAMGGNQGMFMVDLDGVIPRIGNSRRVEVRMGYAQMHYGNPWFWETANRGIREIWLDWRKPAAAR